MASTPSITIDGEFPLQAELSPRVVDLRVPTAQKRNREVGEGAVEGTDSKRLKPTMAGSVAEEMVCPITTELPFAPVTAEDGRIYERSAIEMHIRVRGGDLRSPVTNEPMGPRLFPAVQVRNIIRLVVESGAINGELAMQWNRRAEEAAIVEEAKKKAEDGDATAMCDLGGWYLDGENGLSQDAEPAYHWFKKAADLKHPIGTREAGRMLLHGLGTMKNTIQGVALLEKAAAMGHDMASFDLGTIYFFAAHGMKQDYVQAKFWLQKAVSGTCSIKEIDADCHSAALGYLRGLHRLEEEFGTVDLLSILGQLATGSNLN